VNKLLYNLWAHLQRKRKIQFICIIFLMLLCSLAEVLSIGLVIPFLGALTDAKSPIIEKIFIVAPWVKQLTNQYSPLLIFSILFGFAGLAAGILRLLLLSVSARFSFSLGSELSYSMYMRTLYQPYEVHISRNSSEVINNISNKASFVIYNVISPALLFISSGMMLVIIFSTLLIIESELSMLAISGFAIAYLILIFFTKKAVKTDGLIISSESSNIIKALQEGLGGIRDILLDRTQIIFCEIYGRADKALRRAQCRSYVISSSPRIVMESVGILVLASLAYTIGAGDGGISAAIPILGALAFGAQRCLPLLQQLYSSWTVIQGARASLKDILSYLEQPIPCSSYDADAIKKFNQCIEFKDVSFRYGDKNSWALQDVNFKINKGQKIGIYGETGSGKSTLLDLLLGLLKPNNGLILIDGNSRKSFQEYCNFFSHVPQAIFLIDGSFIENIAFGVSPDKVSMARLTDVVKKAKLDTVIEDLQNSYSAGVGERGVKLSGGQRQRVGIARALYKGAPIIIFDEATSALDVKTEKDVMDSIIGLDPDITVIIVSHRIDTLKGCDQLFEVRDSRVYVRNE
jgi:ABC-type multidrug transport system fused ATPase/permease subunit